MSDIKIDLDRGICCGSGMCASLAPTAFGVEASGLAAVLPGAPTTDLDTLVKAAKSCPTLCITLHHRGEEIELF
ncbi:MAG: ferredoxin [Frankiales bacterium]|nr:ferredoxin [Frankiales bacterium]